MVSEIEQESQAMEFDINDPALSGYAPPDIDTEAVPKQRQMAPPPDGLHFVKARLGTRKEGESVYIKGTKGPGGQLVEGMVIANVKCRVYDRTTGLEGAYLGNWWPTSIVWKGQTGSQLTAICYLAGKPVPVEAAKSLPGIKAHVEKVFAEAGEDGILLFVKTRWTRSVPKFEEIVDSDENPTGLYGYVYKPGSDGADKDREYEPKVYGEAKIKKLMALQGVAPEDAHLWFDPVAQEERGIMAEIQSLEDPTKFEFQS